MAKKWYIQWFITEHLKQLVDDLLGLGVLELGEFELKHHEDDPAAPKSPFKINLRTRKQEGPLIPDAVRAIAEEMFRLLKKKGVKFDLIAGVPQAGEPFAEIVSQLSGKTLLKLRKRISGGKRRITGIVEGGFSPGQVVLLVDDVLTFGGSKKEAILVLRKAGLQVSDLVIFIDRGQGGLREMEQLGCSVYCVSTLIFLLDRSLAKGKISSQKRDEILRYVESSKRAH